MELYQPWSRMSKWIRGIIVGLIVEIGIAILLFLGSLFSYSIFPADKICEEFGIGWGGGIYACGMWQYFLNTRGWYLVLLVVFTPVILALAAYSYSKLKK